MSENYLIRYPRLAKPIAEKLIRERCNKPIDELIEMSSTHHKSIDFAPTGNRIQKDNLGELQRNVRACASKYGYPDPDVTSRDNARDFDAECTVLLHKQMDLQPTEAARIEMWSFMTCVLLPDVVRWRYFGPQTGEERFIGANRGLRRNTFGRLWWRAYLFHQPHLDDPYELIWLLNEDDHVALTERSSIAVDPQLVTAAARAFLNKLQEYGSEDEVKRRALVREATKRIRRRITLVSFESMSTQSVQRMMNMLFQETAEALLATTS